MNRRPFRASSPCVLVVVAASVVLLDPLDSPATPAGQRSSASSVASASPRSAPSRFGRLGSDRWSVGGAYRRRNLVPVSNLNPAALPQPERVRPFDVAVSGDGSKVYVTLQGSELVPGSAVAVVDAKSERTVRRVRLAAKGSGLPPASSPFRLTVHPGGRYLLVTSRLSNFGSVIDMTSDEVAAELPLDFYAQGVAFDRAGRTAYVACRTLDQVLVVDVEAGTRSFRAGVRVRGGADAAAFGSRGGLHGRLRASCGGAACHAVERGGFAAHANVQACLASALGANGSFRPDESLLARAILRASEGGYADSHPRLRAHADARVWERPDVSALARALESFSRAAADGPGIPVGNPGARPKVLALSADGETLFVGNTGTQEIAVVDVPRQRLVGAIHVQNVVNDMATYLDPASGRELLIASTLGAGFGVARERDPFGGESWDRTNRAAHFTVRRDRRTGRVLPLSEQEVLGPFEAVDGTAAIKFRDVQNDLLVVDTSLLPRRRAGGAPWRIVANRVEAHALWTRYTSDTAESTAGDTKGDFPPELLRVRGAFPERFARIGDRLFVTMQGSNEVQELRIRADAPDPADRLVPVRNYSTGLQPIGIAAGRPGSASAGRLYVANHLSGSLSVIEHGSGRVREVLIDPMEEAEPFPATDAERGELYVHTSLFSSDGDQSCFHCHYLDMGDGRPWGVSQVVGQEAPASGEEGGALVIGGTMGVPQMRGLFGIEPFFYEGVLSIFEPRSMIMEHAPAEDFAAATPQGDFTRVEAHRFVPEVMDVQSGISARRRRQTDSLDERRDEMFRALAMRHFGKAYVLRDFQRFVGAWQSARPRLLPSPFDRGAPSVARGEKLFHDPQVGCVSCHPPPHFAHKNLSPGPEDAIPPVVTVSNRDGSFTLVSMNRLDAAADLRRDLEPADAGRAEEREGHYTSMSLRGLFDRPPVFLHHGMARGLREVVATPGHPALATFLLEPLLDGVGERPGRREVGFNETFVLTSATRAARHHLGTGGRIGVDTHGGTSHLTPREVDDLVDYLLSIE